MRKLRDLSLVAGLLVVGLPIAQAQVPCDRDCLKGFTSRYLNALVAHKPDDVPAAANLKFTEDGETLKLGEGLWKNISGLRPYRWDILDIRQGVAGALAVVDIGGSPALLALRLKIEGHKLTEAETLVVHNQAEGMIFDIGALQTPSKAMTTAPEPSQRDPREKMIEIAERYPGGLKIGSFVKSDVPFAPEAYRFENGRLMAGPGCTFIPGCDNIKGQRIPTLPGITARVAAVDEQLGIVWLRMNFGPGSTRDKGTTLQVFEAFKVYGGQIHAVEAFMKQMPPGEPSE
jgi:hypothetical protein